MFDATSYEMGISKAKDTVEIEAGEDYTFTDPGSDGNIVITKEDSDGEQTS